MLLFPFRHNWKNPLTLRLTWKTIVHRSHNGTEVRYSANFYPMLNMEASFLLHGVEAQKSYQILMQALENNQDLVVPLWFDMQRLTSNYSANSTVFNIETTHKSFSAGSPIVFLNTKTLEAEFQIIQSVAADQLTIAAPSSFAYPRGVTAVYPAVVCYLESDDINIKNKTDQLLEMSIQFYSKQHFEIAMKSWQIKQAHPNWSENPQKSYKPDADIINYDLPNIITLPRSNKPFITDKYNYLFYGRENIYNFLGWLQTVRGKEGEFEQPSYSNDFEYISHSTNTLSVKDNGFNIINQRIAIFTGTAVTYNTVINIVTAGGISILTLQDNLNISLKIRRISLVYTNRLNEDAIEIAWSTDSLIKTKLAFLRLA